jgi:hypothetical protein
MTQLTEQQACKMFARAEEMFILLNGYCEQCKKEIPPEHCEGCRIGAVIKEIMEAK